MKQLVELVNQIESISNDIFNPETYFDNKLNVSDGMINSKYVLGNLYAKGYSEISECNFEIFKDHSTWQIWVWKFDSQKQYQNQFSTPYYNYDKVREFLSGL